MSFSASRPLPLAGTPDIVLVTPDTAEEMAMTRAIFLEYAASLGIDLCFQNFDEELAALPGDYAEPRGALLLALVDTGLPGADAERADVPTLRRSNGTMAYVAGCCALRPLDTTDYPNAAEMKRLYVRPQFRGLGLGRQLAEAILDAARGAGYACVLLDTLDDMESARALYEDLGFAEVPPYYHNPIAGSHYLKVDL
jgi:ribosomal protein S18 acetylase RimI-like enzyme